MKLEMVELKDNSLAVIVNGQYGDLYPMMRIMVPESELPWMRSVWCAGKQKEFLAAICEKTDFNNLWEHILVLDHPIGEKARALQAAETKFIVFANYKWRPMLRVAGRFATLEEAVARADEFGDEYATQIWYGTETDNESVLPEAINAVREKANGNSA
ncbi:MAG TPA: hypothetical protein VMG82_17825 [Candidatus Sulfotelmatobacter sp.]|nr:hypothetical protein [Candidatus Sulfotelmatobacter sp.]